MAPLLYTYKYIFIWNIYRFVYWFDHLGSFCDFCVGMGNFSEIFGSYFCIVILSIRIFGWNGHGICPMWLVFEVLKDDDRD